MASEGRTDGSPHVRGCTLIELDGRPYFSQMLPSRPLSEELCYD